MNDTDTDTTAASSRPVSRGRLLDFGRRARSPSPRRETIKTSILSRFPFLKISNTSREHEKKVVIMAHTEHDANSATKVNEDVSNVAKPFMNFRGGCIWHRLPQDLKVFNVDVFSPIAFGSKDGEETDDDGILSVEELKPSTEFRALRVLKITGMMQSYQKYIWETVWLNRDLTDLWLEMALEPEVTCRVAIRNWPAISAETKWKMKDSGGVLHAENIYHGHQGDGSLNPTLGIGEYLDGKAIEKAKMRAIIEGNPSLRLPVKNLTLAGFVVDAGPFHVWFDAAKLRRVTFKWGCIDAGLFLPDEMKKCVEVCGPKVAQFQPAITISVTKKQKGHDATYS